MPPRPITPIKKEGYGDLRCQPCGVLFPTMEAMLKHKAEKRAQTKGHIHCQFCGIDFVTEAAETRHIQERHAKEQNLHCPACHQGPFLRLAALVDHIERGHCPRISGKNLDELRDQKMEFTKNLVSLTRQPVKNDFSDFFTPAEQATWGLGPFPPKDKENSPANASQENQASTYLVTKAASVAPSAASTAGREHAAFLATWNPTIRRSNAPSKADSLDVAGKKDGEEPTKVDQSKPEQEPPAWSVKNNFFPNAPAAQRPTTSQLQAVTAPSARMAYDAMDKDSPDHPNFNAMSYYCDISERFTCPKLECTKNFKNQKALVAHLKSVHGGKTYRCPVCFKKFFSLGAVAAHAESSSQRCNIRESNSFGAYVDQLTAGMVDLSVEKHEDGTNQYLTADSAERMFHGKGKGKVPGL